MLSVASVQSQLSSRATRRLIEDHSPLPSACPPSHTSWAPIGSRPRTPRGPIHTALSLMVCFPEPTHHRPPCASQDLGFLSVKQGGFVGGKRGRGWARFHPAPGARRVSGNLCRNPRRLISRRSEPPRLLPSADCGLSDCPGEAAVRSVSPGRWREYVGAGAGSPPALAAAALFFPVWVLSEPGEGEVGISLSRCSQPTGPLLSRICELVKHGWYHAISLGQGCSQLGLIVGGSWAVIEGRARVVLSGQQSSPPGSWGRPWLGEGGGCWSRWVYTVRDSPFSLCFPATGF